jgi:hypothetical protein
VISIKREHGATRFEFGPLWLIRCASGFSIGGRRVLVVLAWGQGAPERDPTTKWEGSPKPGSYWKECTARLARTRGVRPEEAMCRFPYCDCAKLSAGEKAEWERRRAECEAYHKEWVQRVHAEREAKPAVVDKADDDLDDVAARLPALERLKRDFDYRLPESGKPLAHIVLTREQAIELLALCAGQ